MYLWIFTLQNFWISLIQIIFVFFLQHLKYIPVVCVINYIL